MLRPPLYKRYKNAAPCKAPKCSLGALLGAQRKLNNLRLGLITMPRKCYPATTTTSSVCNAVHRRAARAAPFLASPAERTASTDPLITLSQRAAQGPEAWYDTILGLNGIIDCQAARASGDDCMNNDRVQTLTPRLGVRRACLKRRFSTLLHRELVERRCQQAY